MAERADAARNRQAVLAAAYRLICERQIAAPSMDEIAAEAGVGKGTLFRRFGDRAGLITALAERQTEVWQVGALARTEDESLDPAARAIRFMTEVCDMMLARRPIMRALATLSPEARFCGHNYQTWLDRLAELITSARPDLDAEHAATSLFATLNPDLLDHLIDRRGMSEHRIRSGVVQLTNSMLTGSLAPIADLDRPPAQCDDADATNSEGVRGSRCESGAVPPL